MNYSIDWSLLQPVNVGAAIEAGFQRGATRSALSDLATDPTNESALSRLGMFEPEQAMQMRDRARQEGLRRGLSSAFDPMTGNIDPVAARSAYAAAGDIPGAIEFDQGQAQAQAAQQQAARERLLTVARLLDEATDEPSYQRGLAAARQMGLDVSSAPPQFDASWVAQQRQIVGALSNQQEMTTFMRDAQAAGVAPGTPEFRRFFENRYAAPPRVVMVNGQPMLVSGAAPESGAPPELTDDDIRALENGGGPAPAAGPATFPQ